MQFVKFKLPFGLLSLMSVLAFSSCSSDDDGEMAVNDSAVITVENVIESKSLSQFGTFQNAGSSPVLNPGESTSFSFYAGKGQAISFAAMYGKSYDLFFAPANPGIKLYQDNGDPVTGNVSSQIRLWDNGTRVNQAAAAPFTPPGTAESPQLNVSEIALGVPASQLLKAELTHDGGTKFTLKLTNTSGGTANETPISAGVWAVSHSSGTTIVKEDPIFSPGKLSANGLTDLAETGKVTPLTQYLTGITGPASAFSPVVVVVYSGNENPIFKTGENDRGQGLKELSQQGNADVLANFLKTKPGVKEVFVLKDPTTNILQPRINGSNGGKASQTISARKGDRIALAMMYAQSNDWFIAATNNGVDGSTRGDISSIMGLFDNGTLMSSYPGAHIGSQPAQTESQPVQQLANPNQFNTLPSLPQMIKVTIQ
ncbi:spondin domain-containing protein [Chryseobacterium herbae]|uniref:Spondin domain-containing protein n=1 Tax=Chryseobacterium herbae TaxID=2976476 RepID=A0ABT2ING1_9FLAO|nr:spondin domain-containing protein [Chryseobacterium sp. pc1-10]MCT2560354.1 spondin domain-containing protein [Chryseobacterium sp. pc1-10]